jgi:DNA-directed RNA polymerase specialized sigma24 family protein
MPITDEPELGSLLAAYQLQNPELSILFVAAAGQILRRMATKHGRGLPKHEIEDVVQETFLSLANPALVAFDASRGNASAYLQGRLLNAVKTVQTMNGLRRAGTDFDKEPQREFVPIDDLELASPRGIRINEISARHTAHKLFKDVDADVREACMRVYAEGEPRTSVAADLKMNRFALARKLSVVRANALQMMAAA